MLSIVTCSVGGRLKALYDDTPAPMPEHLGSLLRALEERQRKPAADYNRPEKSNRPCSATTHCRQS
jgi:hypothetical protein